MQHLNLNLNQIHEPEDLAVSPRERKVAAFCHLGTLIGFFFPFGAQLVIPAVFLFKYGKQSTFINEQSREAINFQLSISLYAVACLLLVFAYVGVYLLAVLIFFAGVAVLMAYRCCNKGIHFRYPLSLRIL